MLHLLLLALVTTAPQEKLDPSKHPWAKWKPGTWVKYTVAHQTGESWRSSRLRSNPGSASRGTAGLCPKLAVN